MTPAEKDALWFDLIAAVCTVAFMWLLILVIP